jgi:hypothetical protein
MTAVFAVRRHTRSPVKTPLEFTQSDPRQVTFGFARDICVGGMFVETEFPAPLGTTVTLRVTLPGLDDETVAVGVVRWTRHKGMGIKFLSIGAEDTRVIAEIVAQWLTGLDGEASPAEARRSA